MRKLESNVGYKSLYRKKKKENLKMAPITKSIEIQIVFLTDGNSEDAGSNPSHVRQSLLLETCQNLTKTCQNKENYDRSRRKKFFFLVTVVGIWLLAQREKKSNSKVIQSITAIAIGQNDGRLLRVWPWMIAVKTAMATLLIALSLGNVTGHCENWWPSR